MFDLQPAQSPDLNKLDLCFFHSLQRQAEAITHTKTVDGVMAAVDEAFQNYDPNQLKRVHALLFQAYRQILESEGGNQYKIFHTGIRDRLANGEDPWDLSVPKGLKKKAKEVVIRLQNELSLR